MKNQKLLVNYTFILPFKVYLNNKYTCKKRKHPSDGMYYNQLITYSYQNLKRSELKKK